MTDTVRSKRPFWTSLWHFDWVLGEWNWFFIGRETNDRVNGMTWEGANNIIIAGLIGSCWRHGGVNGVRDERGQGHGGFNGVGIVLDLSGSRPWRRQQGIFVVVLMGSGTLWSRQDWGRGGVNGFGNIGALNGLGMWRRQQIRSV